MMRLCERVLVVNDLAGLVSRLRRRTTGISAVGVVTDRNVRSVILDQTRLIQKVAPSAHLFAVEPGEISKSLETVADLSQSWLDQGVDRKSLIINIGGGVVSDLGGFAASIFKRGVKFINVPTTLLAMVDASVGGKTGVNLSGAKNQIGTFSWADEVIIWPGFLKWLPQRELSSGFAECVKHGLLQGGDHLKLISRGLQPDHSGLIHFIGASVQFKEGIVAKDQYEAGVRQILNFGHTVGHAFESASYQKGRQPWLHGEAVAAGMMVALRLSVCLAGLSNEVAAEWEHFILEQIRIPSSDGIKADEVMNYIKHDKKNTGGVPRFVLLKAPGVPIIDVVVDELMVLGEVETVLSLTS